MEMTNQCNTPPEVSGVEDKAFGSVQAQMALQGIEVHRVTGAFGREAFTVNVKGAMRTLDTLPQVQAYARCLGVTVQCG
jgi:hypothetical protein